jgi:exodeoxyribonuclease V alpha subunit
MREDIYTPVVMDGGRVWRASTHKAERGLAWGINALMVAPSPVQEKLLSVLAAGDVMEGLPFPLSQEQREAVAHACTHKVSVLTGGAGTGKSTITKIVVDAFEKVAGRSGCVLCSPTGKAAKRLSEVTGRIARTIHSTLYASKGKEPIINDHTALVVVDEASMLDTIVGEWLISDIPETAHILFVGDDNQLPSVGAGRVLHDLQTAGVPTFRLQETHRNDGAILDVVYGALSGSIPAIDNSSDVLMYEVPDADHIPDVVCRVVSEARQTGTCKVIAPQRSRKAGEGCGWNTLNLHLQEMLNPAAPGKAETRWFGGVLREGDELLWTENNKGLGLVNGDDVVVEKLKGGTVTLDNGHQVALGDVTAVRGGTVTLDNGHQVALGDVTAVHGYACTTHKAQGSEYDTVVFVCHSSHKWMLTRRQVYTALSRAKQQLVIIGERSALDRASRNLRDAGRNTALVEFMGEN